MSEIKRLRSRLKNVQKNVTEYRMTVSEAQLLLKEIDQLLARPPETKIVTVTQKIETGSRVLDGGSFM